MSVGTPAYMSPEQATGDRALDARSDVYSLGSVLFEMLAGEQPYTGPTMQAILMKRLSEPVPRVRSGRPSVPGGGGRTRCSKALAVVPADRYATAALFAQALDQAASDHQRQRHGGDVPVASRCRVAAGAAGVQRRRRLGRRRSARRWPVRLRRGAGRLVGAPPGRPPAPASANHLAVLPFAVHGGRSLDFLAQGMVDLLSRNLDGAGEHPERERRHRARRGARRRRRGRSRGGPPPGPPASAPGSTCSAT